MADYASKYINESPDPVSAQELLLWTENDSKLVNQDTSIIKNLVARKARGTYSHELAAKLYTYLVDNAAKNYNKEVGGGGLTIPSYFPKKVREAVAEELRDRFEEEYELGNYDQYVPKKYLKPIKGKNWTRQHSTGTSLGGMRG